jgi:hypothetical protein
MNSKSDRTCIQLGAGLMTVDNMTDNMSVIPIARLPMDSGNSGMRKCQLAACSLRENPRLKSQFSRQSSQQYYTMRNNGEKYQGTTSGTARHQGGR